MSGNLAPVSLAVGRGFHLGNQLLGLGFEIGLDVRVRRFVAVAVARPATDLVVVERGRTITILRPSGLDGLGHGSILAAGHVLFPSHANEVAQHNLELLFDEIDTLEEVYDDYTITTVGAVLN